MNLKELLQYLDLETLEKNLFRGHSPMTPWGRIFGGLIIAQGFIAAQRTIEGYRAHSLHAYFLEGGDPALPIVYETTRVRQGRSFATRAVSAIQNGRTILTMMVSFQMEEAGLEHQSPMPDVPPPEKLPSAEKLRAMLRSDAASKIPEAIKRYFEYERPVEMRPVHLDRYLGGDFRRGYIEKHGPRQYLWMRSEGELPDDPIIHQALLAYMSDMSLLDCALIVHQRSAFQADMQVASLDHAIWFHQPFRADDWLLYAQQSPIAVGARGLAHGGFFLRDGRRAASVAQEGLMRVREKKAPESKTSLQG